MNQLVSYALDMAGISIANLFWDSYAYYEVRISRHYFVQVCLDFEHKDKVPGIVEDYCFEILLHRIIYENSNSSDFIRDTHSPNNSSQT